MDTRDSTAAALVAAIALLAVVASASPAGGVGTSADASPATGASTGGALLQTAEADDDLRSGGTYWQGWRLHFDASGILEGSDDGRTFELWRVTEDGELNQRVGTFEVGEDGTHAIDTSAYTGRLVIRYGGDPVYVQDGRGFLESPPDGSSVTVERSAWRVQRQTLAFSWTDPSVYAGQATALTVTSNRDGSVVAVSGSGLSFANLTQLFPRSAFASDFDARANDSVLLLEAGGSTRYPLNTTGLASGDRSLTFDVVDTSTAATARLTVHEPGEDRHVRRVELNENVGDVVTAELACGHCFLVVGGADQGLLDVVELRDLNDDGRVTVRINTRYVGMATGARGYPDDVDAYTSPADEADRYGQSADLEAIQEELVTTQSTLNDLRTKLGLDGRGRVRPTNPGSIELVVASSDFLIDRSEWGDRPPLGGQLVVRDHHDARTVELSPRSLEGVAPMVAPGEGEVSPSRLRGVATPGEEVALGDRAVFRIDVSGVFGYLAGTGVDLSELVANDGEGLYLRLERLGGGETTPGESLQLRQLEAQVVADDERNHLYLVVRTGGPSPSRLDAGRYRASLELRGVAGRFSEYSIRDGHDGYPYLPPGARESVSGTVQVAEPSGRITSPAEGSEPRLNADGALVVDGTTSVAPSSTLTLVAESTEFAWETRTTTTVEAGGNWSAGLGVADAPSDTFDVTVFRGQDQLATQTYTVRPPATDGSSADGGDGGGSGTDGGGGGAGGQGAGGGLVPGLSGIVSLAVPVGGAIGVIVVLWAAWRLVIRRILI